MKLDNLRFKNLSQTLIFIICGNVILAFAVAAFIIPQSIIMGGVTGIAILVNRFIPVSIAALVLVLNITALIFGLVILGKKFFVATVASSLIYPSCLALIQKVPGIASITDNQLLSSIFGGLLVGIAVGCVMRVGASTGGTDVLNLILHKTFHLPVSVFVYLIDFTIIGGQALFSDPEQILYSIIMLIIETFVLNQVIILGRSQIQLFVISEKYEEIRWRILTELQAGATMIRIETGCLRHKQSGVLCVIHSRKLYAIKELIHSIDPNAFITIAQVNEVRGQGFTLERKDFAPRA